MKQQTFEQRYQDCWAQMDQALIASEKRTLLPTKANSLDPQLPELYRRVCHHLSLAQERCYSSYLIAQLNNLVLRGHQQLYQRQTHFGHQLAKFVVYTFANRVRENAIYIWLATAIFYGPALVLFALVQWQPEMIYSFMSYADVTNLENMYDPSAERVGTDRDAQSDFQMFGHYIQNNISIGFKTFATGLLFCLGSLFYMIYNGIYFGAVSSHIANIDYHDTFFPFVIGHGSFELTAITIAGAGGLMLGYSLINPGQYTRLESLKQASRKALDLLYGVIIMLVMAAFIEAFWSSNSALPLAVKYTVGSGLWAFVIGYFFFAGKSQGAKQKWN